MLAKKDASAGSPVNNVFENTFSTIRQHGEQPDAIDQRRRTAVTPRQRQSLHRISKQHRLHQQQQQQHSDDNARRIPTTAFIGSTGIGRSTRTFKLRTQTPYRGCSFVSSLLAARPSDTKDVYSIHQHDCTQRRQEFSVSSSSSSIHSSSSSSPTALSSSSSDDSNDATLPFSIHTSMKDTDLIDRYDAFILDQFGVLHNGVHALDGAIECVQYLLSQNKKLVILSNTSAPASKALEKLPKLGFPPFQYAVTSGEEASRYIQRRFGGRSKGTKKALFITWDTTIENNPRLTALPQAFLEKCGPNIEIAQSVDDADFLLLHGSEVWLQADGTQTPLGEYITTGKLEFLEENVLKPCIERGLTLICANPDIVVQTPDGNGLAYMPGRIADRYMELGATDCHVFGKPHVEHFEACIELLGMTYERNRIAHVGDSLHHDIMGANDAGIANLFVASGIHKQDLQIQDYGTLPSQEQLNSFFQTQGITPTHVVSAFRL